LNNVLVVGERPEQARALAERLGLLGLETIPCARDWKLAVRSLTGHKISLILAEVDQSQESRDFFQLLRELTDLPIVAFGSKNDTDEVVWYLEHGATSHVARTTAQGVLAAKLAALLGANGHVMSQEVVRTGNLTIDIAAYSVTRDGVPVQLTPIEFRLLQVLAENAGAACSQGKLLETVWGPDFRDCAHYLRLYMGYLRQKLEVDPKRPRILLTQWGYGYRLATVSEEAVAVRSARFRTAAAG
jgi:two-component system, OmpR family, KDP operon response regulator KdpE